MLSVVGFFAGATGCFGASTGLPSETLPPNGDAGDDSATCAPSDCGPLPGYPTLRCSDGTYAGPTGRCLRDASGTCAWEVHSCPSDACGGTENIGCPAGEYCDYGFGNCPVPGTVSSGSCKPIPSSCPSTGGPLPSMCGCDGNSYAGPCNAAIAGVTVAAAGSCAKSCGAFEGGACPTGFTCAYPDYVCPAPGATGTCQLATEGCPAIYAPVCGCDGKTYGNGCAAHQAGVVVSRDGTCDAVPPPSGMSCGGGPTPSGPPPGCPAGYYCDYTGGSPCGATDNPGVCVPEPSACPPIAGTACGCDGKVYASTCDAHAHGTDVTPCAFGK